MTPPARAAAEVGAVVLTGAVHLVFEEVLHAKLVFIGIAAAAWLAYIAARMRRDRAALAKWGFTAANLGPAFRATSAFGLAAAAALAVLAAARGTLVFSWPMLVLALLYPLWGWIQQFLVQALVAANLRALRPSWPTPIIAAVAAVLFGVAHWPDPWLMALTAALGLAFTPLYLRQRNLWPLGLWHGWLGVLAYYWVLARDPWREFFLGG